MKKSSCAPEAGKRIFSSDRLNCVSMKVCVNMSELRCDIRRKTVEGGGGEKKKKKSGGGRGEMLMHLGRAGAHFEIRHDTGADTKPSFAAAEISRR